MCGIVGVVGAAAEDNIVEKIIDGLEKLEYRGYDSSGIAVVRDGGIECLRAVGKLQNLKMKLENVRMRGSVGIGHTRWATHGKPAENNAHPIVSGGVAIVHNGIIENYLQLKAELQKQGFVFKTETDTETVAHLLQRETAAGLSPREAFRNVLGMTEGSYAIAAIFSSLPNTLFVVGNRSPLAVGTGENMCAGSDVNALSSLCDEVVYPRDGEWAEITANDVLFFDKDFNEIRPKKHRVCESCIGGGKGEYAHHMLKEIMEQPNAVRRTLLYNKTEPDFKDVSEILILACGTSNYAGMVAKYWFEKFLRIPTNVEIASEYRYRSPVISDGTLAIAVTQSGETVDTLEALEYVHKYGNAKTAALANVRNSAVSRVSDFVFYTEAGIEVGVASTKTFTAQLAILAGIAFCRFPDLIGELQKLPELCEKTLELNDEIRDLAGKISSTNSAVYLGRGPLYPIALEGALKLKEVSYIHAEGFAAGEMKHGPIALIDDNIPVICLCPYDELFEKTSSNVRMALARGKNIIVFTDAKGAKLLPTETTKIILPEVRSEFAPILYVIPLQLLAYHTAVLRGADVDKPRNLAKSVTVE
ncbi:MAG: glutamine--fructose-6-phosphate transaminase (isomerizing) [Holosporaceae bacterium]|nr:glutamine--fructose-6-phosphate transaminase (isomerizing) [Holosporaceae bacterium]